MELKIKFGKDRYRGVRVVDFYEDLGLDFVDEVRHKEGINNLSLDLFPSRIKEDIDMVTIPVSEEKARKLGFFTHESTLFICVKNADYYGQLNKYAYTSYSVEKNESTGEVLGVFPVLKVKKEKILSDWEAAGCPLVWDLQKVKLPGEEEEKNEMD